MLVSQEIERGMKSFAHVFDPAATFKYAVFIEMFGILEGMFTEVNGLSMQREVESYKEGGMNNYVHRLPGRVSYGNVTLKKGVTWTLTLWDWFRKGLYDGKVDKRDVTILVYNHTGIPIKWWNLENAWPVKWEGPHLKASESAVAIESLEVTYERLTFGLF